MDLRKELVESFYTAKDNILRRLKELGLVKVELYAPKKDELGLYLVADGGFISLLELGIDDTSPATPEEFIMWYVSTYDKDLIEKYFEELGKERERVIKVYSLNDLKTGKVEPFSTFQERVEGKYTKEKLEEILQEGINVMEKALS